VTRPCAARGPWAFCAAAAVARGRRPLLALDVDVLPLHLRNMHTQAGSPQVEPEPGERTAPQEVPVRWPAAVQGGSLPSEPVMASPLSPSGADASGGGRSWSACRSWSASALDGGMAATGGIGGGLARPEMTVRVGVCAMEKKTSSKPMRQIISKLLGFRSPSNAAEFTVEVFSNETILNQPIENWVLLLRH
jgi:hypothetical protein